MAARLTFRIPGQWPGILFFAAFLAFPLAGGGGTASRLAAELAEEGASEEGWREARRAAHGGKAGECGGGEEELLAVPRLAWSTGRREAALAEWERLAGDAGVDRAVRERASLELGEALAASDAAAGALPHVKRVFLETEDPGLFRTATADLDALMKRNPKLKKEEAALAEQLELFRSTVTPQERRSAWARTSPPSGPGVLSRAVRLPGNAVVWFYRSQISPAIGSRCALTPSCSEFFLQATSRHGLLGIPLGADRLVREPDVLKRGGPWVLLPNGQYRVADPVGDHDYWFHSGKNAP